MLNAIMQSLKEAIKEGLSDDTVLGYREDITFVI
jgi:hypothetical protein